MNESIRNNALQNRVVVKLFRGVASDDVYLPLREYGILTKAFRGIYETPIFETPWDNHDIVLVQNGKHNWQRFGSTTSDRQMVDPLCTSPPNFSTPPPTTTSQN